MREHDRTTGRSDEFIRPRYAVYENVPGALSSNKGEDFRCVLEETAKVADENAIIPRLATGKDGKQKWSKSGCIMGDGWSIAWRVHDAQFWGVPQRRKRISLVADFGGETAPEILFERESVFRDTTESEKEGQGVASDVRPGIEETGRAVSFQERAGKPGGGKGILIQNERTGALSTLNNQSVCAFKPGAASRVGGHVYEDDVAGTVRANAGDNQQAVVYGIGSYDSNAMKSSNPYSGIYEAETSRTLDLNGGSPACNQGGMAVVQGADVYNGELTGEIAATLTNACDGTNTSGAKVCFRKTSHAKSKEDGQGWQETEVNDTLNIFDNGESRVKIREDEKVQTLSSRMGTGGGNVPLVMEEPTCLTRRFSSVNVYEEGITPTLEAGAGEGGNNMPMVMDEPYNATTGSFMRAGNSGAAETLAARYYKDPQIVCNSVVRRLTPLECERLQGYPDGWTDIGEWYDSKGKKHKDADSPRYKALGNSIALPFWQWLAERMVRLIKNDEPGKEPTMGSLFDGIGGFPLVFSRCGCTPVWASEIEEFAIAVTKLRFKESDTE